jgi:hypothetical protein
MVVRARAPSQQRAGGYTYASLYSRDDGDGDDHNDATHPARAFATCPSERSVWPEYTSGWLSRIGFLWFSPMVALGSAVPVEMSDLWLVHENESSAKNCGQFEELWEEEVRRVARLNDASDGGGAGPAAAATPTLIRPMFHLCGTEVLRAGGLLLLGNCAKWLMPLLMQQILLLVEGSHEAWVQPENAYLLAIAVGLCTAVDFMCSAHYTWFTLKAAWHVRQSLVIHGARLPVAHHPHDQLSESFKHWIV